MDVISWMAPRLCTVRKSLSHSIEVLARKKDSARRISSCRRKNQCDQGQNCVRIFCWLDDAFFKTVESKLIKAGENEEEESGFCRKRRQLHGAAARAKSELRTARECCLVRTRLTLVRSRRMDREKLSFKGLEGWILVVLRNDWNGRME